MAKFLKRIGTKKQEYLVSIKIKALELHAQTNVQRMTIEWVRGDKRSETKKYFALSTDQTRVELDEIFTKESVFYLHQKTNKYDKKDCWIRVKGHTETTGYKPTYLGQIKLELSNYIGMSDVQERMQLEKSFPDSFIEFEISITLDYKDTLVKLKEESKEKANTNLIEDSSDDDEISPNKRGQGSDTTPNDDSTAKSNYTFDLEDGKKIDEDEEEKDFDRDLERDSVIDQRKSNYRDKDDQEDDSTPKDHTGKSVTFSLMDKVVLLGKDNEILQNAKGKVLYQTEKNGLEQINKQIQHKKESDGEQKKLNIAMQQRLEDIEKYLEKLHNKYRKNKTKQSEHTVQMDAKVKALEKDNKEYEILNSQLTETLKAQEEKLQNINSQISDQIHKYEELHSHQKAIESKVSEIVSTLTHVQQSIGNNSNGDKASQETIQKMPTPPPMIQQLIVPPIKDDSHTKEEIAKLHKQVQELQDQLKKVNESQDQMKQSITTLQSQSQQQQLYNIDEF
eukprot:403355813